MLAHGHVGRFADWQLLLLTEAAPALLLGALLPWLMSDSPQRASWLTARERSLLLQAHADDEPPLENNSATAPPRSLDVGSLGHIALFASMYFAMQFGLYAQSFWLPKILAGMGVASRAIGWHVSIVYLGAAAIMLAWGLVTDRAPTQRWTCLLYTSIRNRVVVIGCDNLVRADSLCLIDLSLQHASDDDRAPLLRREYRRTPNISSSTQDENRLARFDSCLLYTSRCV